MPGGGNGAIQDVDNLGWKLAAILKGMAPERLLSSYDDERIHGADENIANSSRATNFMTPKSSIDKVMRDEVLHLASDMPFARKLVNSGRLSVPCSLAGFPLQTPSNDAVLAVGSACKDAPLRFRGEATWLLNHLGGEFVLLQIGDAPEIQVDAMTQLRITRPGGLGMEDVSGLAFERYGAGMTYLIRPDQHVAAAFRLPTAAAIRAARDRALGMNPIGGLND